MLFGVDLSCDPVAQEEADYAEKVISAIPVGIMSNGLPSVSLKARGAVALCINGRLVEQHLYAWAVAACRATGSSWGRVEIYAWLLRQLVDQRSVAIGAAIELLAQRWDLNFKSKIYEPASSFCHGPLNMENCKALMFQTVFDLKDWFEQHRPKSTMGDRIDTTVLEQSTRKITLE